MECLFVSTAGDGCRESKGWIRTRCQHPELVLILSLLPGLRGAIFCIFPHDLLAGDAVLWQTDSS